MDSISCWNSSGKLKNKTKKSQPKTNRQTKNFGADAPSWNKEKDSDLLCVEDVIENKQGGLIFICHKENCENVAREYHLWVMQRPSEQGSLSLDGLSLPDYPPEAMGV